MPRRTLALALSAAIFAFARASPSLAAPRLPLGTFPVHVAVVAKNAVPFADDAWIDAQLAKAEENFGPLGIHFRRAASTLLDERFANLETRADRDALAAETQKGVINIMLVASLRDVDDTSRSRMGVHWRPASALKKHYVILTTTAAPATLAHELGHFFGLSHTAVPDNLMSYTRTGATTFLDSTQVKTVQAFARLLVAAKEIRPEAAVTVVEPGALAIHAPPR